MSDSVPYWVFRGLLGSDDAIRLQAEGWAFDGRCLNVGDAVLMWGERGGELRMFYFANPDDYPDAWQKPAGPAVPETEQLSLL